jgi:hypothetical protein
MALVILLMLLVVLSTDFVLGFMIRLLASIIS